MSKGNSQLFANTKGTSSSTGIITNKIDYNAAESSEVGKVDEIIKTTNHSIAIKGSPNSVIQKYDDRGTLISERYYDGNGNAYLDIDYSSHGNQQRHPIVPHQHRITIIDNKVIRKRGEKIKNDSWRT